MKRTPAILLTCAGVLLILLDQWLKFFARTHQAFSWYIVKPWLGWEYLENPGIAFGLPIPNAVLIVATPIILLLLGAWFLKRQRSLATFFGAILIIAGAISNFIDRLLFEVTIDYLRIITSVINLADVMIVVGAVTLFFYSTRTKAPS